MDKLPMCRICLAEDVQMYIIVNKKLRQLYEKLTDIPFVTADRRPILACFFCCAKLKQAFRLMTKCLEAEEQFAQMMNEDYEPKINPELSVFGGGFIISPVEQISIMDKCQTESIANEPLPAVCDGLDFVIIPKEDNLSDDNSYLDVEGYSEIDSEGDVPFMEVTVKVEETVEVSTKLTAAVTNSARREKPEDTTTADFKKPRNHTSKPGTSYKERDNCYPRLSKQNYYCDICQRSFCHKSYLKIHKRVHTGEKPYKCDVCQRGFSQKNHLTKHFRIHTGEKPYKCRVCQRGFSETGSLAKHIRIHTGEKPYHCDVCQRGFNERGGLRNHIRTHTGEKPFKCSVCQRGFCEKGSLTKHFRTHTGEYPYKCDVCQHGFSQTSHLSQHIRRHTDRNFYTCDICERGFSRKYDLTRHVRVHALKYYECDVCQRSFSRKYDLTKHTRCCQVLNE